MPNWCSNKMKVTGPEKDILSFKEKALAPEEALDLNNLTPKPDSVLNQPYGEVGYNWEIENWGCKWGAASSELTDESAEELLYRFDSPWNCPLQAIATCSKDFPTLTFTLFYEEQGNDFMGHAVITSGAVDDRVREFIEEIDRPVDESELFSDEYKVDYVEQRRKYLDALKLISSITVNH